MTGAPTLGIAGALSIGLPLLLLQFVICIALLVAVVGPKFASIYEGAKVKTTSTQIAQLKTASDTNTCA